MKELVRIIILSVLVSGAVNRLNAQNFKFTEQDGGVLLTEGKEKIFFYQRDTKSHDGEYPRANYIHPLYGLNGEILTEDFPADHLHQRGIYWTWHQFFLKDYRIGDPWVCEGIKWEVQDVRFETDDESATLIATLFWVSEVPDNGKMQKVNLVKEETRITYKRSGKDAKELIFDIKLTAQKEGIRIGGSEDPKGYGGFSVRVVMPDDLTFHSRQGEVEPKVEAIQAGEWIDMKATFDPTSNKKSGITIMYDPKFLDPFHGWILRKKGSMQNPAYPGSVPVLLEKDVPLRMRYKILVHSADWKKKAIEKSYREFIEGE